MIVAFDMDGTLCNIEHRLHLIKSKPKNWPAFFRACVQDDPVWSVIKVCNALSDTGNLVEIWSGRSDVVRTETTEWLQEHQVKYWRLRMRKDGDYRADDLVKAEWFDALPADQRPVLAFDDRRRVVDFWRSRGVKCCQVEPGDF